MNKMRKCLALFLAVLLAACAAPAWAADTETAEGKPEFNSLLPLESKGRIEKTITGYLGDELKAVPLTEIFSEPLERNDVKTTDSVMWAEGSLSESDNFIIKPMTGTVDLSQYVSSYDRTITFQAIVGKADQLEETNVRYTVSLKISGSRDILSFTSETGTLNGQTLSHFGPSTHTDAAGKESLYYMLVPSGVWDGGEANLKIALGAKYQKAGRTLTVYDGEYDSAEAAEAANKNVTAAGKTALYEWLNLPWLSVVVKDSGNVVYFESFQVYLVPQPADQIIPGSLYEGSHSVNTSSSWITGDGVETITEDTVLHKAEMTASNKYKLKMTVQNPSDPSNPTQCVRKAVVGKASTLAEMTEKTDIKDALFGDGYETAVDKPVEITIADQENHLQVWHYEFNPINLDIGAFYLASDSEKTDYVTYSYANSSNQVQFYVPASYPLESGTLYLRGRVSASTDDGYRIDSSLAARGKGDAYYIKNAFIGNSTEDIKESLFSRTGTSSSSLFTGGYSIRINHPIDLTIVDMNDKEWKFTLTFQQGGTSLSTNTYLEITGAEKTAEGALYNAYQMPSQNDSYYQRGYQTVFLLDSGSAIADSTEIFPTFDTGSSAKIYAGKDTTGASEGAKEQQSGKTPIEFHSGQPIQYSAAAQDNTHLKNYWVTFVTQEAGKHLFVNGVTNNLDHQDENGTPLREVLLTSGYDANGYHDIFFANSGSETLTNLKIETAGLQGVTVDPYWTLQDGSSLAPFTKTSSEAYNRLPNIGKIRLVATDSEEDVTVSGTITLSADGIAPITFKVTGIAGTPKIKTTELPYGVKYVPYSTIIQTNSMGAANAIKFSLVEEESNLPAGFELRTNGELYGMPMEASEGVYYATVSAEYTSPTGEKIALQKKTFPLTFLENTDENVWNYSDDAEGGDVDYHLLQIVPNSDGSATLDFTDRIADNSWDNEEQTIISPGAFATFEEVYLDGNRLVEGIDYEKEEGSTKITLKTQTLRTKGNANTLTHTIAVSFRIGNNAGEASKLKTANQNYTIKQTTPTYPTYPTYPSPPSGPSASTAPQPTASPAPTPRPTIAPTPTPEPENVNTVSIPSTASDGTAHAALTPEQEAALVTDAKENSRDREVIKVEPPQQDDPVYEYNVELSSDMIEALAAETATALTIDTPLGGVTFFSKDLPALMENADLIIVEITQEEDGTGLQVEKDGQAAPCPFRAEIPLPSGTGASPSLVLAQYDPQTSEWKIQPKSALSGDRLTLTPCTSGVLLKPLSNPVGFTDTSGHWAQNDGAIDFMASRGLFKGIGGAAGEETSLFAPNRTMSRAMMVTVLHRLESTPKASSASTLLDIEPGIWYEEAVAWGQATGIVLGTGGNAFSPDTNVSREQIALFLYRYSQHCGMDTSGRGDVAWHPDHEDVHSWASDAISWCVNTGILRGDIYGDLNPQAPATRAECAVMLTRFIYQMNGLRWN